jgi:hypothetical protein
MGLLKHGLLPFFTCLHAYTSKVIFIDDGLDKVLAPVVVPPRDLEKEPPTPTEKHLSFALGGAQLAFMVNNICAILMENAHYRGMALLLEAIYLAADSFSYWKMGSKEGAKPTYALLGLSLLGLGVHAMEPGIFAKDKNKM